MPKLSLRIIGRDLPGRRFACYDNVHVGVQRHAREEVFNATPGDADEAAFVFDVDAVTTKEGEIDFRGPFVQGKRGERFVYLTWGAVDPDGRFEMFRRAKLRFSDMDPTYVERALTTGAPIEGTLGLTSTRGGPLCASVRPPIIQWRVLETVSP
jgi:hypothetical protein